MHAGLLAWYSRLVFTSLHSLVSESSSFGVQILGEEQDQVHWYHHRNQARLLSKEALEVIPQQNFIHCLTYALGGVFSGVLLSCMCLHYFAKWLS